MEKYFWFLAEIPTIRKFKANLLLLIPIFLIVFPNFSKVTAQIQERIQNGGFESGSSGWTVVGNFYANSYFGHPHSGSGYAYLSNPDGTLGNGLYGDLYQSFYIPAGATSAWLTFYYSITSFDVAPANDYLLVSLKDGFGTSHYINIFNNLNGQPDFNAPYYSYYFDLTSYIGQTVTIDFLGTTNNDGSGTTFRIDDVSASAFIPSPHITLNPTYLPFSALQNGPLPSTQTFTITNTGGGTLNWSVSSNAFWLNASPTSGNGNFQSISAWVSTTNMTPGTYNGTLTVSSSNADNQPQYVNVSYIISPPPPPPHIFLNPSTLPAFSATQGGPLPASQTFTISNSGGGTLNWSISGSPSWLNISPTADNNNSQTITASVNTTSLSPGTYNASLMISSSNADNSPQYENVSYSVSPAPPPPPPTVTSVIDAGTGDKIAVKWDPPANEQGIISYEIGYGSSPGNYPGPYVSVPVSEHQGIIPGLQYHTPYWIAVRSVNSVGLMSSWAVQLNDRAEYATIPIVLVYGWNGKPETWTTMASWLQRDHFSNVWIANNIDKCGVLGESQFEGNANNLSLYISSQRHALSQSTGVPVSSINKLDFLAHSMGGMIVRRYLGGNDIWSAQVLGISAANVIMLGTPNGGMDIADFVEQERRKCAIEFLFGLPGIDCIPPVLSDAFCPGPAEQEFMTSNIDAFNKTFFDKEPVGRYALVAGLTENCNSDPECGTDCFVNRRSVFEIRYPGYSKPDTSTYVGANHTHIPSPSPMCSGVAITEYRQIYDGVIYPQFSNAPVINSFSESGIPQQLSTSVGLTSEEPSTVNFSKLMPVRQFTTKEESVYVSSEPSIEFQLYDFGALVGVTLLSPSGTPIDSTTPQINPNVKYGYGLNTTTYTVNNPEAGNWVIQIQAASLPDSVWPVLLLASADDQISFNVSLAPTVVVPGDSIFVKATLQENAVAKTGASVNAFIYADSSVKADSITLFDDGLHHDSASSDGIYGAGYAVGNEGSLSISIEANGTTLSSQPFHKEAAQNVFVTTMNFFHRGDLNRDFLYTASDVVLELNCAFLGSGNCPLALADVNCDGAVTPSDVVLELNKVFMDSQFPCP